MGKKAKKKAAGKKKRQKNNQSFSMQVRKVLHQKGAELALAVITGIATNFITDFTEYLFKHRKHSNTAGPGPAQDNVIVTG